MYDYLLLAAIFLLILDAFQIIDIRCLLGFHKWVEIGSRSTMTFNKNSRGVTGGEIPVYQCSRCGKVK